MTAEHAYHWQAPEPCGHAEHPGKFINDWTDKERGAFMLGQKMLRADLQVWQQRFGDCEATVLGMEAVVEAARQVLEWPREKYLVRLNHALEALDTVPRRAASPEPTAP